MTESTNQSGGSSNWLTWVLIAVIAVLAVLFVLALTGVIGGGQEPAPPPAPELPTAAPPATEMPAPPPTEETGLPDTLLTIIDPANGTVWDLTKPITVYGSGAGLPNDKVFVVVVDKDLNILGQTTATLGPPDANGLSVYSAELTAVAPAQMDGKILVGVLDDDGTFAASAGVFVTLVPGEAYITITEPQEGATVPPTFTVSGMGAGLPENNVVIQAVDSAGNELAMGVTTVNSEQLGGEGDWTLTLTVAAAPGTTGQIIAFSPDPVTNEWVASATINVIYGQ